MSEIVIYPPDPEPHEHAGSLLVQQAKEVVVTCNDEREVAAAFVAEIDSKIKGIKMQFDGSEQTPGPVLLAYRAWKSGVALRDRALLSFVEARTIVVGVVKRFEFQVEQDRIAESRKAEAAARKKAEEERERAILEAKKLGDREAVKNLKEAPISVPAVAPITPEVTKAAGLRRSSPEWDWEVANADKIPCKYHMLNDKAISAQVKALGPKHGIPGITVFDRRSRA